MKFTRNEVVGASDTILAANDYTAIPICVTETAAVKAGYPMVLSTGKKAESAATADGILLYDVDPKENPNGSLLVAGVVDSKKAAKSGFTYDTAAKTALKGAVPGIVLTGVSAE